MAEDSIQLPLAWIGSENVTVQLANQFMVQVQPPGEIFFTIGQVAPPAVIGTPEEQMQQLKQGWPFVPVQILGKYSLNVQRLDELIELLTRIRNQVDQ